MTYDRSIQECTIQDGLIQDGPILDILTLESIRHDISSIKLNSHQFSIRDYKNSFNTYCRIEFKSDSGGVFIASCLVMRKFVWQPEKPIFKINLSKLPIAINFADKILVKTSHRTLKRRDDSMIWTNKSDETRSYRLEILDKIKNQLDSETKEATLRMTREAFDFLNNNGSAKIEASDCLNQHVVKEISAKLANFSWIPEEIILQSFRNVQVSKIHES